MAEIGLLALQIPSGLPCSLFLRILNTHNEVLVNLSESHIQANKAHKHGVIRFQPSLPSCFHPSEPIKM